MLTVNTARAVSGKGGNAKAVWDDAETWESRLKSDGLQTETEVAAAAKDDAVPFDTLTPGQAGAAAAAPAGAK